MHRAAQHVALEDGGEVVAVVPADDRHEVGQRLGQVRRGDADRVTAVDEALAGVVRAGIGVRLGEVQRHAHELGRRGDAVATVEHPRRRRGEIGEVPARDRGAVDAEVDPVERRVQRVGRQVGGELVEVVGVRL